MSFPRFIGQTTVFSSRNGIDTFSHARANQKKKTWRFRDVRLGKNCYRACFKIVVGPGTRMIGMIGKYFHPRRVPDSGNLTRLHRSQIQVRRVRTGLGRTNAWFGPFVQIRWSNSSLSSGHDSLVIFY